jgi:hypothetical protein
MDYPRLDLHSDSSLFSIDLNLKKMTLISRGEARGRGKIRICVHKIESWIEASL